MTEVFAEIDKVKTYHTVHLGEEGTKFSKIRFNIKGKPDICPICREDIIKGGIILLLNNYKLFPNIIIHSDCCDNFSSNEEVIEFLRDDYAEVSKRKAWFN